METKWAETNRAETLGAKVLEAETLGVKTLRFSSYILNFRACFNTFP